MAVYEKTDILQKWSFRQFVSANGRHAIDGWRKDMPQGPFRADMDTFLKRLAKLAEWSQGDIGPIRGAANKGLTEIGWPSGKVEHRIIGYRLEDEGGLRRYLMLIGCTHKGRVYTPADAIGTAAERRKKIGSGEATHSEYLLITNR